MYRFRKFSVALASLLLLVSVEARAAGKKTKIDTPVLSCGSATQASLNIQVCAPAGTGATGLPAGFSIQWMTASDLAALGGVWPSSDSICHGSFSGNANLSRYNLSPGQCVTVDVGEFLFDNGASTNCAGDLACGTEYVFRAFGHATSTLNRSDFTSNRSCSTLPCELEGPGCTEGQGYWKNHNDSVCAGDPASPLCVAWPSGGLPMLLGTTYSYDETQLLSILNTPAAGNGLIALAHQLIAAKLNIANGADGSAVAADIAAADALIGTLVVPPVGAGYLAPALTSALTTALTNFNDGATGPGHCP
jgi:hypothetical protein